MDSFIKESDGEGVDIKLSTFLSGLHQEAIDRNLTLTVLQVAIQIILYHLLLGGGFSIYQYM